MHMYQNRKRRKKEPPKHLSPSMQKRYIMKQNRRKTKWQRGAGHYGEYFEDYLDDLNRPLCKSAFQRVAKLRNRINSMEISKSASLHETMHVLVKLIDAVTKFYDAGLIKVGPVSKSEILDDFNSSITTVVRRDASIPYGYTNRSMPGEKVTEKNLYIGEAVQVSHKTPQSILVKEYQGEKYRICVPMIPITKWLKGNVKTLDGHKASITLSHHIELIIKFKRILNELCLKVLEGEEIEEV